MTWATKEFKDIDLGDKRLNERAEKLAYRLGQTPSESIPNACKGWAETQSAYRFYSNDSVNWEKILEPHWQCSVQRMKKHAVVLNIQDTTELNFNGKQIEGLGPLSYEAQRGMYLHATYAITTDREPLGVMDAWMWSRQFRDDQGVRKGMNESTRWLEGYERVVEQALKLPDTRQVYVADREADILALFAKGHEQHYKADLLIRSRHNRSLPGGGKLWDQVQQSEALGQIHFTLAAGRNRKARKVTQSLRVKRVQLKGGIEVSCLIATEENAPSSVKPVQWKLLTNRPVHDLDEAVELIDWYRARWEIEMFFLVLKEGCKVQDLQLCKQERIKNALAMYMVVAWRINRMMRLGRCVPTLSAELVFEKDEWQAAYILNKKRPPEQVPDLRSVIRLVAILGGFLGRKGDGEPGVKVIWSGLDQISVFVEGIQFVRQEGL